MSNVQNVWHILYIIGTAPYPSWKYFGEWPGETEEDAIAKSKIDGAVAATSIRVFPKNGGKRFQRAGWEEA